MPTDPRERLRAAMLVLLVAVKAWIAALSDKVGIDGAYYSDVAAHVRDGHGLVTDVSLFHAAMPHFPHPTPIYPLWPLLLGYVSRVVPIEIASVWLPTVLSVVALLLAERLARAVRPEALWGWFDAGHLVILVFGMNTQVIIHATRPYTENLAFVLLVAFLWRIRAFLASPGALRALEIGAWLGVLVMCRSQLVIAACAVATLMGGLLVAHPGRVPLWGATMVVGASVAVAPWAAWLSTFTELTPATLLSFQTWQAAPLLPKVDVLKSAEGPLELLLDRAQGLGVAFDPLGKLSYVPNFVALTYAPFVALPLVWRGRRGLADALRDPTRAFVVFLVILGGGWALSLQLLHKGNFAAWNFWTRHAVPALPLFLVSGAALLAAGGWFRRVGALLIAITTIYLGNKVALSLGGFTAAPVRRQMAVDASAWVRAHTPPGTPAIAAADDPWPQYLGRAGDGVGWHWVHEKSDADELRVVFDQLGARFLLVPRSQDRGPGSRTPKAFAAGFTEREDGPKGWRVYERRAPGAIDAAPEDVTEAPRADTPGGDGEDEHGGTR